MKSDAVVIGAGIMGSSAAYELSKMGRKTILVDQFPVPHSRGSSAGHSRIIRTAHHGWRSIGPIMIDALIKWREIENESKRQIFRSTELVAVGSEGKKNDIIEMRKQISNSTGEKIIIPKIEDINKKYNLNIPLSYSACIDPTAGVLFADKCLSVMQDTFKNNGGKILDSWTLTTIDTTSSDIRISGPNGELRTKSLVLCAGPWTKPLLDHCGVHLPLRTIKTPVYYWARKELKSNPKFIYFALHSNDHFFSLPDYEYPGYYKTGLHDGPIVTPNERDAVDTEMVKEKLSKYIDSYIPFLHPEPAIEESCMYTVTPDSNFILDQLPQNKNIVYACGFSGHGFKMGPTIGVALAKLATGQKPHLDFSDYSSKRFI